MSKGCFTSRPALKPNKSTLSYMNQHRRPELYEDLFWSLMERLRSKGQPGALRNVSSSFQNRLCFEGQLSPIRMCIHRSGNTCRQFLFAVESGEKTSSRTRPVGECHWGCICEQNKRHNESIRAKKDPQNNHMGQQCLWTRIL